MIFNRFIFIFLLIPNLVFAQIQLFKPITLSAQKSAVLFEQFNSYKTVQIQQEELKYLLKEAPDNFLFKMPFSEQVFELHQNKVFAEKPSIIAMGESGSQEIYPQILTYKGYLKEEEIYVTLSDKGVYVLVNSGGEKTNISPHLIENGIHVLYKEKDIKATKATTDNDAVEVPEQREIVQQEIDFAKSNAVLTADLAIESDFETYQKFGSIEAVSTYITAIMNVVSAIYERDINLKFQIKYLRVWTTIKDPYPDDLPDNQNSTSLQLERFTQYWQAEMQDIDRTLALYISVKNSGGGRGFLDVLCKAYGYSYAGSIEQVSSPSINYYSWNVNVVAHELGHNVGSPHTHNCNWQGGALDGCYPVEGFCQQPELPQTGSLMSYCHLTEVGIDLNFLSPVKALLRQEAMGAPCLNGAPIYKTNSILPVAQQGKPYNLQLELKVPDTSVRFIRYDDIPHLTLASNGILSGTPLSAGTFSFWVEARDTNGRWVTKRFTLEIKPNIESQRLLKYVEDGRLDAGAQPFSTNGKVSFYATFDGERLYVAYPNEHYIWQDKFLFVSDKLGEPVQAPVSKAGKIPNNTVYLFTEGGSSSYALWHGIFPAASASFSTTWYTEGSFNVRSQFGKIPEVLFLAYAQYQTYEGGYLMQQIPQATILDQNIDVSDFAAFPLIETAEEGADAPKAKLFSVFPNPIIGTIGVQYYLFQTADVSVSIVNSLGQQVRYQPTQTQGLGFYNINWENQDLPQGMYFVMLQVGEQRFSQKIMVIH